MGYAKPFITSTVCHNTISHTGLGMCYLSCLCEWQKSILLCSHYFSEVYSRIYFLSPPGPACCSCHVFLGVCKVFKVFSLSAHWCSFCCNANHLSRWPLSFFLLFNTCYVSFSVFTFLSQAPCENIRTPSTYPGNMLPHHPGQGNFEDFTCWADPGEASKCVLCNQSQPYSKNYPTHGRWGTKSKKEALFT